MPRGLIERSGHAAGGAGRDVVLVLALFALGGVVAGLLWRWLWTPLRGTVLDGTWYPDTNASEFSSTGLYVLVGLGTGLLLGALSALLAERRELLTLALVAGGSVLAAAVMLGVGRIGMPTDPHELARTTADRDRLPGTLEVRGLSAYAAVPTGALAGLAVVFVGLARKPGDEPTTREPAG